MGIGTKQFTVRYYVVNGYKAGKPYPVSNLFSDLIEGKVKAGVRSLIDQGSDYQLRGIESVKEDEIRGYFVRFREDRPLAGSRNNDIEKPVELGDDEEVIEKNHFTLFKFKVGEVLVFQTTMEGPSIQALARYLSAIAGDEIMFTISDLLTSESVDSLISGKRVQFVQFKVAKPTAKKYEPDPEDTWTQQAMDFMSNTGATRFEAKIVTYSQKRGLFTNIAHQIKLVLDSKLTKKLRIKVSDVAEPIDLFAERIRDKIVVPLDAGVVMSEKVYSEIWASMLRNKERVAKVLGSIK